MDTNPKYLVRDEIGELVVTRSDIVQRIKNTNKMSEEEFEKAISDWIIQNSARRLFSDSEINEQWKFDSNSSMKK
jgi:hypothetical protein